MLGKKRKIAKRLQSIGSSIVTQFVVEINNEDGRNFDTRTDALAYIKAFREENVIFSLKMYRIEIYSL